jgi:hypothetical protein
MAYDPTLPRDSDKVRLIIGDTDNTDLMLHEDEINYFIGLYSDLKLAASYCCRVIAARFARDVNYRFSTLWQDASDAYKHYMELADRLMTDVGSENMEGPIFTSSTNYVDGNPIFYFGITDNPPWLTDAEKEYLGTV